MIRRRSPWVSFVTAVAIFGSCYAQAQQGGRKDRYGDSLPEGAIARLGTIRLHFGGEVSSAAVSSDGSILIAAGSVCDGKSAKQLPQFKGKWLGGVALFSEDMKTVTIGQRDRTQRWDIATGELLKETKWNATGYDDRTVFTPDLKFVSFIESGAGGYTTRVIETATGKARWQRNDFIWVALANDGTQLAFLDRDKKLVLWDLEKDREIRRWKAHDRTAGQICQFSPDGKTLASSSLLREIRFWDVQSGKMISEIKDAGGRFLLFTPDGSSVAYAWNDTIFLRDVKTGKETRRFIGHASWLITDIAFAANGKYLASASRDHTVIMWDVATGKPVHDFEGHRGPVDCLAFSPKGDVLASGGGEDHALALWDLAAFKPRHFLRDHDYKVNCLAFDPAGKRVATGDGAGGADREAHIRIWDADKGKLVRKFFGHMDVVSHISYFGDGKGLVSAGGGGRIRVWDSETGERLHQLRGVFSRPLQAKLDAQPFADVKRWDAEQWKKLEAVTKHGDIDAAGGFGRAMGLLSPDGKTYALTSADFRNPSIKLSDTTTKEVLAEWRGHTNGIVCMSFSPDSKTLASGSRDTTILLWDVQKARDGKAKQ